MLYEMRELTCCKEQYPAAIYGPMARATFERLHILSAPIEVYNRTKTAKKKKNELKN